MWSLETEGKFIGCDCSNAECSFSPRKIEEMAFDAKYNTENKNNTLYLAKNRSNIAQ